VHESGGYRPSLEHWLLETFKTERESYKTWAELAGYFDGDGTVEFSVDSFTIHIRLAFDENWEKHLQGIASFLRRKGVSAGKVRKKESFNTWHLVVSNIEGVRRMARALIPHAVKKGRELQAVLSYFRDEITGDQFVNVMNAEVSSGQRTGKLRPNGPRFTHSEGVKASRRMGEAKRRSRRLTPIPQTVVNRILKDWREGNFALAILSRRYGYSPRIVKRVIADRELESIGRA